MVERERRAIAARQVVEGEPRGEADRGLAASRASAPRFAVGQGAAARFQGLEHRADLGGETCSAQPRAVNRGRTGPTKAKWRRKLPQVLFADTQTLPSRDMRKR